ncbi:MAG: hypothetical protein H7Y18_18575 [Clostridiaceae bacterium]|nr:hypothetical protein [Clostridiaceae bacterium]
MDDLKYMYKKVGIYSLYVLVTLSIILGFINFKFILPYILGLAVGIGNLIISGIVTSNTLVKNKVNLLIHFGFIFKIFTSSIIGIILFTYNKHYLIVYMSGYISHFIPIALYTFSLKDD